MRFFILLCLCFISNLHASGTSIGNGLVSNSIQKSCKKADGVVVKMSGDEKCEGEIIEEKSPEQPASKPAENSSGSSSDKPAPKK